MTETLPYRLHDGNTLSVIYLDGNGWHPACMDAKTARTTNIRTLVASRGGPTEFADLLPEWSQAQVSQWISETKPKGIGHALARKIERTLGLPGGWLDQPHDEQSKPERLPVDQALLARSVRAAQEAFRRADIMAGLPEVAELATCIYVHITEGQAEKEAARIADEFLADMIAHPTKVTRHAGTRRRTVRSSTQNR